MARLSPLRMMIIALLVLALVAFFASGASHWLTLEGLKEQQARLSALTTEHPWLVAGGFFLTYVAMTAFSLPSAVLLTLLAGALFGTLGGTVLVSFASTLGATLAMLAARYVLRDGLQSRYGSQLQRINEGFEREGAFYLFALRPLLVAPTTSISTTLRGLVWVTT